MHDDPDRVRAARAQAAIGALLANNDGDAAFAALRAYCGAAGVWEAAAIERLFSGHGLRGARRMLKQARRRFMAEHGRVFQVLGLMQWFWYGSDKRRERFVKICEDKDVQQLTFESYMNKVLSRRRPLAQLHIFLKDTAHLLGIARV